jgi:hypothetical protein
MSAKSASCSLFAPVVKTICGIRKGVSKPCTLPSNPCDPRAPCPILGASQGRARAHGV